MNSLKKICFILFTLGSAANAQNAFEGFLPPEPEPVIGPSNPAVDELYSRLSDPTNMGTFEIYDLMINKQLNEIRRKFGLDKCAYISPGLFDPLRAKAEQHLNAQKILLAHFEKIKASSGGVVIPNLEELLAILRSRVKTAEETFKKVMYLEFYNVARCRRMAPHLLNVPPPAEDAR